MIHGYSATQLSQLRNVAQATGGDDVPNLVRSAGSASADTESADTGSSEAVSAVPDLSAESTDPKIIAMKKALTSVTHMAENWAEPSIESLKIGAAIVSSDEAREAYQAVRDALQSNETGTGFSTADLTATLISS